MPTTAKPKLYNPRHPERTLLYQTVAEHYETWLELACSGQFDGQGGNSGLANAARQAAPVTAQNGSYRKISGDWPRAITQADPNMQACDTPTPCHNFAHAVGFPIRKRLLLGRVKAEEA